MCGFRTVILNQNFGCSEHFKERRKPEGQRDRNGFSEKSLRAFAGKCSLLLTAISDLQVLWGRSESGGSPADRAQIEFGNREPNQLEAFSDLSAPEESYNLLAYSQKSKLIQSSHSERVSKLRKFQKFFKVQSRTVRCNFDPSWSSSASCVNRKHRTVKEREFPSRIDSDTT